MYNFTDLPNNMPLSGSFAPLGVSITSSACHTKLKTNKFNFGDDEKRILKSNHTHDIYLNAAVMKKIYDELLGLLNKLSNHKAVPIEYKAIVLLSKLTNVLEHNFNHISEEEVYRFASICLPTYLGDSHICHCGELGTQSLLSLQDNQELANEY